MKSGRTLILSDGDLPSLVACVSAVESLAGSHTDPSGARPAVIPFGAPGQTRRNAVKHQAEVLVLSALPEVSVGFDSADAEAEVRELLSATYAAARSGIDRVIWPMTAAIGDHLDLDRIAAGADRAVLIGRLVALDAERHGVPSIRIETPYLDLTDRQVADLAAELAVPLEAVWWWEGDNAEASKTRARWSVALEAVGWPIARS